MKYRTINEIPAHIFSNKECTETPSQELRAYLKYMFVHHPNDLEYLWRFTQSYKDYGGCYKMTFDRWLKKLDKDLDKQETDGNKKNK